jgi:hypothetical protein
MFSSRLSRVGLTVGVTVAVVLLPSVPAFADDALPTVSGNGYGYWTENGDKLAAQDLYEDGSGTRAYIYRPNAGDPSGGTVLIKVSASDGGGTVSGSVNISETIKISLKVCNYSGAAISNCQFKSLKR